MKNEERHSGSGYFFLWLILDPTSAGFLRVRAHGGHFGRVGRDHAEHYGTGVIAARVREPRDKAKVEYALRRTGCDNTYNVWGRQFQLGFSFEM